MQIKADTAKLKIQRIKMPLHERGSLCYQVEIADKGYMTLTPTDIAVLFAAKLKANDGLKKTDLPRNFRINFTILQKYLLKPRTEKRWVLNSMGKILVDKVISDVKESSSHKLIAVKTIAGKVGRKEFYNLFYFILDNYGIKKSRIFKPLDRLRLNELYGKKIQKNA